MFDEDRTNRIYMQMLNAVWILVRWVFWCVTMKSWLFTWASASSLKALTRESSFSFSNAHWEEKTERTGWRFGVFVWIISDLFDRDRNLFMLGSLLSMFQVRWYCRIFWTLGWHPASLMETCYVYIFLHWTPWRLSFRLRNPKTVMWVCLGQKSARLSCSVYEPFS